MRARWWLPKNGDSKWVFQFHLICTNECNQPCPKFSFTSQSQLHGIGRDSKVYEDEWPFPPEFNITPFIIQSKSNSSYQHQLSPTRVCPVPVKIISGRPEVRHQFVNIVTHRTANKKPVAYIINKVRVSELYRLLISIKKCLTYVSTTSTTTTTSYTTHTFITELW